MKKGLAILLGLILVAGCSSKDADEFETQEQAASHEMVNTEEDNEQSGVGTEDEENQEDDTVDVEGTGNNGDLEELSEFDIIAKQIDLDTYQAVVQTDNKGKRMITFEDENGHAEYKSIFVKHDNRLKIIQFSDDQLLYNDMIN